MILVNWMPDIGTGIFRIIAADEDIVAGDIRTMLHGIAKDSKVLEIFLKELSIIQPELEERIKDVQNSFSNSDREQDH